MIGAKNSPPINDLDKVYLLSATTKNIIIVLCSYLDWISPFRFLQRNGKPENRNHFSVKIKIPKISFIDENFENIFFFRKLNNKNRKQTIENRKHESMFKISTLEFEQNGIFAL